MNLSCWKLLRIANYSDTSASWSDTATVADIGSPRPNAGEGPGGEGDTSLLIQFQKLSSGSTSRNTCDTIQGYVGPLTPDPSPALGRGEPNSINFFEGRRPSSLYCAILTRFAFSCPGHAARCRSASDQFLQMFRVARALHRENKARFRDTANFPEDRTIKVLTESRQSL